MRKRKRTESVRTRSGLSNSARRIIVAHRSLTYRRKTVKGRSGSRKSGLTMIKEGLDRLGRVAYEAGCAAATYLSEQEKATGSVSLCDAHLQQSFVRWNNAKHQEFRQLSSKQAMHVSLWFRRGYQAVSGIKELGVPLSLYNSASAVVCACNEESTIAAVVAELRRLPIQEIIVILNGCNDRSFDVIERNERITVVHFPERLGHDVARGIGASLASGGIVLFVDGDILLPAEELAWFMLAIDQGTDVALNNISPFLPSFSRLDDVTRCKLFLNSILGRSDLGANSLTAVPHALSRRAIEVLGSKSLIVPPKSQAIALLRGLKVSAPHSVDVIRTNRLRGGNTGESNDMAKLIIGDHIEAMGVAMQMLGTRLQYTVIPRSQLAKMRNAR